MRRNNPGEFPWDEAAIKRLKTLWFDGYSAREIGRLFGVSRNSIIGRVHRSGWTGMERVRRLEASKAYRLPPNASLPPPEPDKPRAKKRRRPPAQLLKTEQPVSKPDPPIGSFTLMDLRFGVCKWPEGEIPAEMTFCGAPQVEGSSYCPDHKQRSVGGARAPIAMPRYALLR